MSIIDNEDKEGFPAPSWSSVGIIFPSLLTHVPIPLCSSLNLVLALFLRFEYVVYNFSVVFLPE